VTGFLVYVLLPTLAIAAICADESRRNASRTIIAATLFDALVEYVADGGNVDDVVGFETIRHPSGHRVRLVTGADVVAGAERLLREDA
jgi:hypothetical protein